ncbi:hypothetical protein [Opitutus sp. GAS368]|uniref:hypothetical protein n=1 Tax=Opitutus sp. GAS368 TaxID=1882749 RepID=UPI00087B2AD1|nr:hypothetical protein [Opitutus sp. GAS368]SDS47111.1 hypothetical protein SAMN05444173_2989 [Opitutus sp. GAS368]
MQPSAQGAPAPIWWAQIRSRAPVELSRLSPLSIGSDWLPLGQFWQPNGPETGFHPGWARLGWEPEGLWLEAILFGPQPGNRARRLNEKTWELGEVCELFLRPPAAPVYLECHVTPENQRLQLAWPPLGLQRVRAGSAPLDSFLIDQPDWMQSRTFIGAGYWVAQIFLPADRLGVGSLLAGQNFGAMVGRYDYAAGGTFVLSATAPLREPDFHRGAEWHHVVLC